MRFAFLQEILVPHRVCGLALGIEKRQRDDGRDEDADGDTAKKPFPPAAGAGKSFDQESHGDLPNWYAEHTQRTRYRVELYDVG